MAICSNCNTDDEIIPQTREHFYIPNLGCVILKKPSALPVCTCPPPDPVTGAFTHNPNCPRHQ